MMDNYILYEWDKIKQHIKKNKSAYILIGLGILIYKKGYSNGVMSMVSDDVKVKSVSAYKLGVILLKNKKVIDQFVLQFDRPIFENAIAER